jgi:signal transduction histidine kinase
MTNGVTTTPISPQNLVADASTIAPRIPTILVVEDDIHLMEGIREILELDPYRVISASSGIEALEILRNERHTPDLIVSDIMMPKMDGYQFFEAVRSVPEWLTIPFIFLTAKGEKADIRLGKAMGADDYVTKPFSAEDLLVAVSAKLKRHRDYATVYGRMFFDMKRRILTILNHEFRTPLTYVIAYADMTSHDPSGLSLSELRDFLKGINAGADRLRRLIENFIMLVDIETGEVQNTYDWRKRVLRDHQRLLDLAIRKEVPFLKEREQTFEYEIAQDTPPILGDEDYLGMLLAQLIDNASKFSRAGAHIHARFYLDESGGAAMSIEDHGRGIPEEEIPRIFDTFYQINREHNEDQGAGAGLAIVRGIADVHKAKITVDSVEGRGSIFTLHFPRVEL